MARHDPHLSVLELDKKRRGLWHAREIRVRRRPVPRRHTLPRYPKMLPDPPHSLWRSRTVDRLCDPDGHDDHQVGSPRSDCDRRV